MNVVRLRNKHRGERAVHHRPHQVEGVANRQYERSDVARAAKMLQLLQRFRVGRFRTAGGKRHQNRIFQHADQAEHLFFQHHVTHGQQHHAGEKNGNIVAANKGGIVQQNAQALRGDDGGDCRENGQRRNVHYVACDLQHNMRNHVQRGHQRGVELLPQRRAANAKEH